MNNKTKTVLFSSLLAIGLLVTASLVPNATAAAKLDNTDYFALALITFDEQQKLADEVVEDNNRLVEISSSLKTTNDELTNYQLNSEAKQLEILIDAKESRIQQLADELNELELKNIRANTVEPQIQELFDTSENIFRDTYLNEDSSSYIGENAVEEAYIDRQFKNYVIIVNPSELDDSIKSLTNQYQKTIDQVSGANLNVELRFGAFEPISCSARDGDCGPLFGGITVANEDETGDSNKGTLGYEAKNGSTEGFIITGHQAGAINKDIIQPHDDTARIVGEVDIHQENSDCDCAFVDATGTYTVDNEIYKASNTVYDVTGEVADGSQTVNSWAYKSGARTNVTLGEIVGNLPTRSYNLIEIYHGKGDSGAPVFDIDTGDDVDLYGMIYSGIINPGIGYAKYHPWDQINSELGTSLP